MPILQSAGHTYSREVAQEAARILSGLLENVEVIRDDPDADDGLMILQTRGTAELFAAMCIWRASEEDDEDSDREEDARDLPAALDETAERLSDEVFRPRFLAGEVVNLREPPPVCNLAMMRVGAICPASRLGACTRPCPASCLTPRIVPQPSPAELLSERPLPAYPADFFHRAAPVIARGAEQNAARPAPPRSRPARRLALVAALVLALLFSPAMVLRHGTLDVDHDGRLGFGDLSALFSIDVLTASLTGDELRASVDLAPWIKGTTLRRLITVGADTIDAEFERAEPGRLIARGYRLTSSPELSLSAGATSRCFGNRAQFASVPLDG